MKYTLSATIPTAQYANLQPSIEVEAPTFQEAHDEASKYIERVWAQYGAVPLNQNTQVSKGASDTQRLKDFFGNEIDYSESTHTYSWGGEVYESGSQYASKFEKPFDGQAIAAKMAVKYGVKPEDILAMWELKARTSREFGTAMHSALQLYGQYDGLATALERDTHLHDHPTIKSAVQAFYGNRDTEKAEYEILAVDHANKRAGRIDRLLITGVNEAKVQDFKFNAVMDKAKLAIYWRQLEFYSGLIEANGWRTLPPQIFHYDGNWHEFNKEDK